MIKKLKPFIAALALCLSCLTLHAQNAVNDQKPSDENIIIHKKDSAKEKITVVIDGDDITVNGKPIDDFKSDDVDIIQQKQDMDNDVNVFGYGGMPMPPQHAPELQAFQNDMMRKIKSNTAFLGVMTDKTDEGAKVTDVTKGSAAEKAGLKEGDIITKVGDDKITGPDDLYKAVGKYKPAEKIIITYLRNQKQATANATLDKSNAMKIYSWNSPDAAFGQGFNHSFNSPDFSFSFDNDKPRLGISAQDTEDGNGAKIIDIDDNDSPAAKAGLKQDDIITQVNGKAITSAGDLKTSMKDVKKGDTVKITFKRNNQTQSVEVKIPKDLKTINL
ncbi:MAG: PDZ domain-containing protein [Parafilimonas sp.]